MTQQPFSRPGAVDLSALKATSGGAPTGGSYSVVVDQANFQSVIESSMTAPVLLAFYSPTQMPQSATLVDDLETLSGEFEGRFLLGRVDIDTAPQIAQAMQIPSIPLVAMVIQGRPVPLFQDIVPIGELRTALTQLLQQIAAQGIVGRHQPRSMDTSGDGSEEGMVDPRYAPAEDALAAGDVDRAVAEYQKLVDANPADVEAAAGLAMAKVLQRTQDVDPAAARTAAAEHPDDVDAQTLVADLDLLGGHVDEAFARLVELIRRTSDAERDQARTHLLGLFSAVGNDDERVLRGRQNLASALF